MFSLWSFTLVISIRSSYIKQFVNNCKVRSFAKKYSSLNSNNQLIWNICWSIWNHISSLIYEFKYHTSVMIFSQWSLFLYPQIIYSYIWWSYLLKLVYSKTIRFWNWHEIKEKILFKLLYFYFLISYFDRDDIMHLNSEF